PIAVPKPTVPANSKTCQRLRHGRPHQVRTMTSIPHVQTPPPNPARSCAISGTSRGLTACKSDRVSPRNVRSWGTNTRVIPTVIIVNPPQIIPVAIASKQARPRPYRLNQFRGLAGLNNNFGDLSVDKPRNVR